MATMTAQRHLDARGSRRVAFWSHSCFLTFYLVLLCASAAEDRPGARAVDDEFEFASLDDATQFLAPSPAPPLMSSFTELHSGEIRGERTLHLRESPYVARGDVQVARGGKLVIEPGVTIRFAPAVGITVLGVLQAVGTPTSRITLTSLGDLPRSGNALPNAEEKGARLVDGPTPAAGRLQFFYKSAWRSVCTNSRNWTAADYETACKQMGFRGGRFWNWVERSVGYSPRLLYEEPRCKGVESSLLECAWQTRQLGSGVCDYHSDLGVECLPVHNSQISHWRGLYFQNAPSSKTLDVNNVVYSAVSQSTLRYVDITMAGSGLRQKATSAIEVVGLPPVMEHTAVSHSAFTGINVTRPDAGFTLHNVTVQQNNGIGVFVNSSQGHVKLQGCHVAENSADGVKYVGHDLRLLDRTDRASIHEFCTLPLTSGQTYPISLSFVQKYYTGSSKECAKYFFTQPGYLLTVHFEFFSLQRNESVSIEVFDGASANERLLFSWRARNYTRPQTVTSTRDKIFIRMKADMRTEASAFIRLTTEVGKAFDLKVADSSVTDNRGRGIAADNIRSMLHVHGSSVNRNGHVAGIHVASGAADVNITNSVVSANNGDGVNITYYGGNRNISRSSVSSNNGFGIAIWLNDTTDVNRIEFIPVNQTTVVEYSQIHANIENGIQHGNYCEPIWVNITGNTFNSSAMNDIQVESCWFRRNFNEANLFLQIGHNVFDNSQKVSILLSPALNLHGRIELNQFRYGSHGSIYIKTKPVLEDFNYLPVRIVIQNNYFIRNRGIYVVSLALSPYSKRETQTLLFTRNFVRENKIVEPFGPLIDGSEGTDGSGRLNPRSMVAAPVVVGSSNVDVFRNILHNFDSTYEIGSQLCDQSQIINATYNWLGHTDENKIYSRLFHRNDRYNLAKIEYIPYLLHSSNPSSTTIIAMSTLVPKFHQEASETIGGEIDGQEMIPGGTYTVTKDINIRPGGKLILQPGVTLKFQPSIGMMVAGKLEARGRQPDDIFFTLKRETIMHTDNMTAVGNTESVMAFQDVPIVLDMKTESILESGSTPSSPLRLLGGNGSYEGRLQMFLDGRWGTVCDYGWTERNAALVCHQLGYTLNPADWRLHRSQLPSNGVAEDVIVSNIRCTEMDLDITKCRSERLSRGEFENSCTHENDVGIRCYEGAWAGVRFSMLAERADLQYMTIEKAGLFDYATNSFKPALQMDFARHNLENVRIVDNLDDGLGVIYSDVFGGKSINNVKNSEFSDNRGNGISLRQLGLRIHGSVIKNNRGSGVSHDPVISSLDQKEIGGWFYMPRDFNSFDSDYEPHILPADTENIDLGIWQTKYIRTEETTELVSRDILVRCPAGYVLGVQLLNPIQNQSTEVVTILDSHIENSRSQMWDVKRDLNLFPITSSSYGIILYYESGTNALGGAVLMLSTVLAPVQNIRNKVIRGPVPSLVIRATKIQKNCRGLSAYYYNRYLGQQGEHYLRKANESIKIYSSEISHNTEEAFLLKAPFWDVHSSNLSEITIHINNSMISQNGHGVRHISRDLRSSNNLFHYVLQDTIVENNLNGGFEISLPYVWQYNENFTHSVYMGNATWQGNRNFRVAVRGHYAVFNITSNVFQNNHCPESVISLDGMEKRIKFSRNHFRNNHAKYVLEFRADSQSEIIGEVPATAQFNIIKDNRMFDKFSYKGNMQSHIENHGTQTKLPTAVIRFDGIQSVKLYRNLISGNEMDYNLIAGVKTARLNSNFYATENWWGSTDGNYIKSRIFDFNNWNNHADVSYQPFLIEDAFDGSVSLIEEQNYEINLDSWIGGRIFKDLVLKKRSKPYAVKSDITVMPGVTLTIQHGVHMDFEANVGILVLGTLIAIGYKESEIVMRPIAEDAKVLHTGKYSLIKTGTEAASAYDSIRLCTTAQNCTTNSAIHEGFLEYFNHTTLQWVPICDQRFTERNAQVVCRELGFNSVKVYYGHDNRVEFHTNSLTKIWTWVQPLECTGDEARLEECAERLNGQVYGHIHQCRWDDTFVFVSCSGRPNEQVFWGGIRFANSDFEENQYEHRFHDPHTHSNRINNKESHLEFVRLESAGILHGEKSSAIQCLYRNPYIASVTILNSANHGVNLIAPIGSVNMNFLNISNAIGSGINMLSLTGEGRESDESSFTPLEDLDLPYTLFSLVDMCDPQKVLTVEEKILVYYKYDNNPVNCVKIFNSVYRAKPVGFRLLQSNLFSHSKLYGRTDAIRLFDGDIYNVSSVFIGKIEADTMNQKSFFKTVGPTLSVQIVASGAPERYGFIAEIVTIPISTISQNRDARHNITYSHISKAVKGALFYATAGEISPTLTLSSNRFERNCKQLYGNFSTCESAIMVDVQNMQSFYFMNNLLLENQGGLRIRADSRGSATSLRGYLHHNLFYRNRNKPALFVEGRQSSPYQEIELFRNYFAQNKAGFEDVIRLRQVVSNFSYNFVHSNIGQIIADISGFDKVRLPIYQTTSHNGFYGNVATSWKGKATIVAGTAGQQYVDNIFENPDNDYEMITVNNSIFAIGNWNSTIELWRSKVDARDNYWSYNNTISVQSRIRDQSDDLRLLEVQAVPFQMNNQSILDGKCPPGWSLVHDTCFIYIAAQMAFHEAKDFCRSENASMPFIRTDSVTLWTYLQSQMQHMKYPEKVWIQDFNHIDECTSFVFREVDVEDCNKELGFICEVDPKVVIDPLSWRADVFAISIISAFLLAIMMLIMVAFCWYAKSKHRHVQRLQRRNSIRQSLRSLNSIDHQGSLRRRTLNMSSSTGTLTKNLAQDYKQMMSNGSIDSMDKSVLSSEASFDAYENHAVQQHEYQSPQRFTNNYVSQSSVHVATPQKIATIGSVSRNAKISKSKPAAAQADSTADDRSADLFELSYRNEGYRDNSTVSGTRNNSISQSISEDTPIIHQAEMDDMGSEYYGNASTLPLHTPEEERLMFLKGLKQELPEYRNLGQQTHSSFLPPSTKSEGQLSSDSYSNTLPYEQKIDNFNFTPVSTSPPTAESIFRQGTNNSYTAEVRRPDSYYTAMRRSKAEPPQATPSAKYGLQRDSKGRPKTVYQAVNELPANSSHLRSKSETLLETDFDGEAPALLPLHAISRSCSQPLETAM